MNPYDPPLTESSDVPDLATRPIGTITAQVTFSADHLVETLTRYRTQHLGRRIWKWIRWVAAILFLICAAIALLIPHFAVSAFMVATAIFLFFSHKIDDLLAQRNFRQSPHFNTHIVWEFSDAGLYSKSELEESTLKWNAFTQAVVFDDGVLIFQGPKMVHWVPDRALDHDQDRVAIRTLLKANLPTNHAFAGASKSR